jgi:hypothetical protein
MFVFKGKGEMETFWLRDDASAEEQSPGVEGDSQATTSTDRN